MSTQLSLASLVVSIAALFCSLMAAFPGLKSVFFVVRDAVLWLVMFLVLGGGAFLLWQQVEGSPETAVSRLSPRAEPSLSDAKGR